MGHTTSYLGRLDITPPVNPVETEWLRAIRVTERAFHPDDPYAVPAHPRGELPCRSTSGGDQGRHFRQRFGRYRRPIASSPTDAFG